MSGQVTEPVPEATAPSGRRVPRGWWLRSSSLLAAAAALGALCGAIWQVLWSPAQGIVFHGQWILAGVEMTKEYSGTAWYVVIALVAGVIWGIAIALRVEGRELTNVVFGILGAVLAGWMMYVVGHALGPTDPRPIAAKSDDYTLLDADLRLSGLSSPSYPLPTDSPVFAVFPLGTATVLAAAYGFSSPDSPSARSRTRGRARRSIEGSASDPASS